jgi:diaminopimelate decarboxylase
MARHVHAAAISARSSGARFQRIWIKTGLIFRSLVRGPFQRAARTTAKHALRQVVRKLSPAQPGPPPSTWRLDRDAGGELRLDGKKLETLLERYGSPVHVVDGARLKENAARFIARPPGASKGCEVYYSYKTNPVPGVLRLLHDMGVGAEATSPYELWLATRLGVRPEGMVYNCPAKPEASVREAIALGIQLLNLNARQEIAPVAAMARTLGKRPRVGIRVAVPHGVSGQFGERIDDGSAFHAFAEALACPELNVVGLHAHLNTEIATAGELAAFLSAILEFTDRLRSELDLELQIIDLGGNLACPTVSHKGALATRLEVALGHQAAPRAPAAVLTIDDYVKQVMITIEKHYQAVGRPAPRVFAEPGRAMTADSQMLLCRAGQVRDADASGVASVVLDAGINVAESLRSEYHQLFNLARRPGAPLRHYRLTGPTCTLGDTLYPFVELPELKLGDGLAIMDSGAYFVPYSTCFSFPRPAVVLVEGGRDHVLRRAETFEDMVALDGPLAGAG